MNIPPRWPPWTLVATLLLGATLAWAQAPAPFVVLDPPNTPSGYLARLLINETPFPGEHAWESVAATQNAMRQILWVLDGRIHLIPPGYNQFQVAGVRSDNIIDVITGGRGRRQCEGFFLNDAGGFVVVARVEARLARLVAIANSGDQPGRFAALLNYAQDMARVYFQNGIAGADGYATIQNIGRTQVTGHAFSWMTDADNAHPGGNYVAIPDADNGSLGGNRFFTLRKVPR